MEASIEVKDNVILRCFKGKVGLADIIDSWKDILARFDDLSVYNGVVSDFLDAEVEYENKNLSALADFLKSNLDRMDDMKIAIVMDTPQVSSTIMLDRQVKHLHIKPFSTRKAAFDWISI